MTIRSANYIRYVKVQQIMLQHKSYLYKPWLNSSSQDTVQLRDLENTAAILLECRASLGQLNNYPHRFQYF